MTVQHLIMSLSPGTRLGHYDVTSLLGEGGMGQVWQATEAQLWAAMSISSSSEVRGLVTFQPSRRPS